MTTSADVTVEYLGGHPIVAAEYWHTAEAFMENFRFVLYSDKFQKKLIGITYISDDVIGDPIVLRKMLLDYLAEAEEERGK